MNAPIDALHELVPLQIRNCGFTRMSLNNPPTNIHDLPSRYSLPSQYVGEGMNYQEAWETLLWWESPLQAKAGIEMLYKRPFTELRKSQFDPSYYVPTRLLFPTSLSSASSDIEETARFISAMIKQGKEFYTAAGAPGVSALTRPLFYFYGALALAQGASASIFGIPKDTQGGHGLVTIKGPNTSQASGGTWPTIIQWKKEGDFVNFYRSTRWDELYNDSLQNSWWSSHAGEKLLYPKFHILECLRCLNYEWGILPPTGFGIQPQQVNYRQSRETHLLHFDDESKMFMQRGTPLNAPLFQVPLITIQFMVLFYFSVLSRYHAPAWQQLQAGEEYPESHAFRAASERVAIEFVIEMANMLNSNQNMMLLAPPAWYTETPQLDEWYPRPKEAVSKSGIQTSFSYYSFEEWKG